MKKIKREKEEDEEKNAAIRILMIKETPEPNVQNTCKKVHYKGHFHTHIHILQEMNIHLAIDKYVIKSNEQGRSQ